jgi:YfiH family protein
MRQVHGSEVQAIDEAPLTLPVCDGLATTRKGLALIVQTADCVPLVLWDEDQGAVAVVHAGWRGALAGVSRSAAAFLAKRFGSRAESIHVAMGPSIGACCYEVGEEVVRAFDEQVSHGNELFTSGPRGKSHLNLIEANSRQLTEYGVPRGQIYSSSMCTSCDNGELYSYRKEGTGVGSLMGVIGSG